MDSARDYDSTLHMCLPISPFTEEVIISMQETCYTLLT